MHLSPEGCPVICRTNAGNQPSVPKRHSGIKILVEQMLEIILLYLNAQQIQTSFEDNNWKTALLYQGLDLPGSIKETA